MTALDRDCAPYRPGTLVIALDGRDREKLAVIVACPFTDAVTVRWYVNGMFSCNEFFPPAPAAQLLAAVRILRLAPEDETTAAARVALAGQRA